MKQVNIRDICNSMQRRQETRQDVFAKVLEKCYMKIERVAAADRLFLFYEVPMFVLGCPLFRIEDCIDFMKGNLEKNGFLVKYYFPNIVYISWNKDEIKEHKLTQDLTKAKELDKLLTGGNSTTAKMLDFDKKQSAAGSKTISTTNAAGGASASRGRKNKIVLNLL